MIEKPALRVSVARSFALFIKEINNMSRIAKEPVKIPQDVKVVLDGNQISVEGKKGSLSLNFPEDVILEVQEETVKVRAVDQSKKAKALSGTIRALVQNLVTGVSVGFEYKLEIVGVGYRAQAKGKTLNLSLGFSHPVDFQIPDGVTIDTPTQTEVVVKGIDKQLVGQVAANIRAYRKPEPYKGKGVRYAGEQIVKKEAKKA